MVAKRLISPPTPTRVRRVTGSVSGRKRQTSAQQTTPYIAAIQKIACQPAKRSTNPPSVGARIGAAPITRNSRLISRAASCPSARSRTTARGMTMLAEPPNAASARISASVNRSGASAQPAEASV